MRWRSPAPEGLAASIIGGSAEFAAFLKTDTLRRVERFKDANNKPE